MKKVIFSISVITALSVSLNASCSVVGVMSGDSLNVRFHPSYSAKKVGEIAPYTDGIEILHCKRRPNSSPWCKISYQTGSAKIVGWVNSKFLYCPDVNYYCVDRVSRYDTLTVRSRATYKSKKVGELSPYAEGVRKIKCVGKWCKISYSANGVKIIGWVNRKYLVPCQ